MAAISVDRQQILPAREVGSALASVRMGSRDRRPAGLRAIQRYRLTYLSRWIYG